MGAVANADDDLAAATAFVRFYTFGEDSDFWVTELLAELPARDPDRAWRLIQMITAIPIEDPTWSASLAGCVGAGPLQALLEHHSERFLDPILQAATNNSKLISALAVVYDTSIEPGAYQRIRAFIESSGA